MVLCCRLLVFGSLLATAASSLSVYPHQLAYFNELAGGPKSGYKHLLHSNLEWGQDLLFLFRTRSIFSVSAQAPFPPNALGHRVPRASELPGCRRNSQRAVDRGGSNVLVMGFTELMSSDDDNCRAELLADVKRYRYSVVIWNFHHLSEATRASLVNVGQ